MLYIVLLLEEIGSLMYLQRVLNSTSPMQISEIKFADIPDVDLSSVGITKYGNFSVEIVDPVSDYLDLMEVKEKRIYPSFIHDPPLNLVSFTHAFGAGCL